MITTYQNLPTHPKIFASLPIPIPFGMASGVVNDVILPATKMVLAKHPEIPVIDLWAPFVGHRELYNQDTGARSGTHVTPNAGLNLIATTTFGVWKQAMSGGGADASVGASADAGAVTEDASADSAATGGATGTSTGGAPGTGGASGGSGPATETGGAGGSTETPPQRGSSGCVYGGGQTSLFFSLLLALGALSRIRSISFSKSSRARSNTR
jgi:hypothetical protein